MSDARQYKGYNGTIVIDGSEIRIERTGVLAKMAHGRSGPWSYPIFAVSGMSTKDPGKLTNGWVAIQLGGEPAPQLGATAANSHPNAVLFTHQHRETFDACTAHLNMLIEHNQAHGVDSSQFVDSGAGRAVATPPSNPAQADSMQPASDSSSGLRADIHAAGERMSSQFGGKREIRRLEGHLYEGEEVRYLATGRYEDALGVVALTSQRLIFLREGLVGNKLEDFPLDKISSVQSKSGMVLAELKIYASGNSSIIDRIPKQDQRAIAEAIRQRISATDGAHAIAPPTAAHAPIDVADQLAKFAALRDQGVISDEEFAAQKSKLLGM